MTLEQVVKNWAMSDQPKIKIPITKLSQINWQINLEEDWSEASESAKLSKSYLFDDAVRWTTNELSKWPEVTRKSYTQWHFKSKKAAEKFKIIFFLKWQK